MSNRTIPRDHWREELDSFSRSHEGWIARVAVNEPGGRERIEAQDLPLQGVSVDSNTSAAAVAVMVGTAPGDHITHEISGASEIAIDQAEGGGTSALRIMSSDGSTTTVALRSPEQARGVKGRTPQ
jgi:hypothetical protein